MERRKIKAGASLLLTLSLLGAGSACTWLESFLQSGSETGNSASISGEPGKEQLVDFIVEVEEGRDAVVLQLTDPQIVDSSQQRTEDRLGFTLTDYWAKGKAEERCFKYVRQVIERSSPDLILLTGDIVYGEFDDDGSCLLEFIEFMESFGIPWAPIFGNHENESKMGVDWQCEQFAKAEHCLFKQRTLTGNGNYSVGIMQGGKLIRVFYMLDSNGCTAASNESYDCGHLQLKSGFARDQIDWYKEAIGRLNESSPDTKISFAYHIPTKSFSDAFIEKYGYDSRSFFPIDLDKVGEEGDFGYIGAAFGVWDTGNAVWEGMKALGVDSVFVGHEHAISASVVYEGIRLQFGQKSSTYDSTNYVTESGEIVRSYSDAGYPLVGGTVIPVSKTDGSIAPYIMLYEGEE